MQVYFKLGSYADAGAGFPTRGMDVGDWGEPIFDGIPQQISNGLKMAKLDDVFTIPKGKLASFYLASNKELTFKKEGNQEFDVSDEGEDFNIYSGLAMEDPFQNRLGEANFFGEIIYCTGDSSSTNTPSMSPSDPKVPTGVPSVSCDDRTNTVVEIYSQPYLNTYPGTALCADETSNLLSIIAHFKDTDGEFATFESSESIQSFDDPDLETKLNEAAVFVMPEIEDIHDNDKPLSQSLTGWGTGPQNILRNYVANGGVMLVTGAHGGGTSFLNDIFGWDLTSAYCFTSGAKNVANSADTVFDDGPDTISCPVSTRTINCNSNNVDCTVMYGDESAALVTVIDHGDGHVIVLGFDYYGSGYKVDGFHKNCWFRHDDWVTSILRSSLLLLASECPQPSTDEPSYEPSRVLSSLPSLSPSYPSSCGCEFDHTCFPADGILLKKAADAFSTGTWDSSHPDYADHGPIEEWCTGLVTNMARLFGYQTVNADLSKWNTAAVVDMRLMFAFSSGSFSSTIGSWDVSSVKNTALMFENSQFSGDISGWDTSSVKTMVAMFRNAAWFNSDISGWTVSSVTNMSSMFTGAASFNIDLAGWDLTSVETMTWMFRKASNFNQNLCAWKDQNFPYDQAINIFKRSGCEFTENPDDVYGGPFCAHECFVEYITPNRIAARNVAKGVMYTISAKSQPVTIKGLGVVGRLSWRSNTQVYYQDGSYDDFEALDEANWNQVFEGDVRMNSNMVVTFPLDQEFTIPAGGTVSVYVVSARRMMFKRATTLDEFREYAESDSFVLNVGRSTRAAFDRPGMLAEFAGAIVYEVQ